MPAPDPIPSTRTTPARWLILLLLGLTALRLLVGGLMGLTDDEAYYRLWSLAPDWGYLDHPPLVAWLMWLGRQLGGESAFGLRLMNPLLALAGSFALWQAARLLFGPRVADRAVLLFQLFPLVGIGSVILTPDSGAVLAATLLLWSLAAFATSGQARWLLPAGLFAGLGLLAKYTILALGLGILLWLLWHRALHATFRRWPLWAGGLLVLLLFLPVLLWNAEHGWLSFQKQFAGRGGEGADLLGSLKLLGVVTLALGVLAAPFAALGFWRGLRSADPRRTLIPLLSLPLLLALLVLALWDEVLGQWPAPLYPGFAVLAAWSLGERRRLVRVITGVNLAVILALYAFVAIPGLPLPERKDTTAQTRGWAELAQEVEALRVAEGAGWIATHSYATTGQLAFRLPRVAIWQLDERARYLNLPQPGPEDWSQPALYVEIERRVSLPLLRQRFRQVVPLGTLERREGGQVLRVYAVYLLAEPKGDPLANQGRDLR